MQNLLKQSKNHRNRLRLAKVIVKYRLLSFYGSQCIASQTRQCEIFSLQQMAENTICPTLTTVYMIITSILTIWKAFLVKKSESFKQLSSKQANAVHWHNVERLGSTVFLHKVHCRLCLHNIYILN